MEKSKIIIYGSDTRNVFYSGDGTVDEWKEKLGGKLTEDQYYVFQVQRLELPGSAGDLRITNTAFLRTHGNRNYNALGGNEVLFPLSHEAKSMLLELINDSNNLKQSPQPKPKRR
jgi:hypothetical protein